MLEKIRGGGGGGGHTPSIASSHSRRKWTLGSGGKWGLFFVFSSTLQLMDYSYLAWGHTKGGKYMAKKGKKKFRSFIFRNERDTYGWIRYCLKGKKVSPPLFPHFAVIAFRNPSSSRHIRSFLLFSGGAKSKRASGGNRGSQQGELTFQN